MTTHFTIGRELESGVCETPTSSLGTITGGPIQLLSWLESQLGLELPEVSFTARMVPYLNCLQAQGGRGRFYAESMKQDEFGGARTLLQWRDAWYEAGWDGGGFDVDDSTRLLDMGTVEAIATADVPPGIGQRVRQVLDALRETSLDVKVSLLDSADVFPKAWQKLFTVLGAQSDAFDLSPGCIAESDLAVLQRRLLAKEERDDKVQLKGDGSVIVLRDGSPQLSAEWISRFAHAQLAGEFSVAVLASEYGATLDDSFTKAGFPRLGFAGTSFWRPVFQVLPLSLELLWKPLDPTVLLQFLTHPMGPIPANVRRPLAEVVAIEPGIGGDTWVYAVETAVAKATVGKPKEAAEHLKTELSARIDFWLNGPRFDAQSGADMLTLKDRVRRVSSWLSNAYAVQEDEDVASLYGAALSQSDELLRTLDRLEAVGVEKLPRESLRRLVEAVRGTGTSRPGRPWQCEPDQPQLHRAVSPAAFLEPVNTVIWWGCDKARLPSNYPWSMAELASLAKNGIELLPLNTQLEWQAETWLRPICAATERLVLVLHDNADGHHPIFDQLLAVAEGWVEQRVDRVMREPGLLSMIGGLPKTKTIQQQDLPQKVRWWKLSEDAAFTLREQESFSSLDKFLYGPYQWVLNYQAKIRPGTLFEIDDGPRLKGTLAHELIERFFNAHEAIRSIQLPEAENWARAAMDSLIEEKGAVLLVPGRQSEKEDFIAIVTRALLELIGHLQSAEVVKVEMEEELTGKFVGGGVRGTVDLIATNVRGECAIVDIKWGGFAYRRTTLVESRYLQLAVYAQLVHPALKQWPALGYFIVRDARMLILDNPYFPDAVIERPENGESLLEFWQRAENTWKWRKRQIESGLIEVTVTGTEPDEESSPGEAGLPMPDTFDAFDDYTVLTGWGERS
ncbi:MAG: PD-(D/E)XK nuclease family protein [Woeseia sp.]